MSAKWSSQVLGKQGAAAFGDLLKDEYAVVLLQGKNVFGDMIYCYVKVALPDIDRLQGALKSDASFNASDFGTVVAAGKGDPPDEVRAEIAVTYKVLDKPLPVRPPAAQGAPENPPPDAEKKKWDEY